MVRVFRWLTWLSWFITIGLLVIAKVEHKLRAALPLIAHNTPHGVLGWTLAIALLLTCIYQFIKLIFGQSKE
ncbi:hypothetical protein OZX58_01270 [Lactobacillus sp. ESL0680]|uniref:hypothetical protein n=1 Tax=Lactobacillus sp. ESL0680 TaxID=2983210 RepID=UPI0023F7CD3F|nr:hypothetical protein [Lactobacillus sp. ESL0680]WEV38932.1 hypothetical protein OZX58_01270 [Lactobacillus sp. ESL0680]